ncbi:hypothetical protein [Campylobacter phage CP81]|uniref:Uncharacterized protein n=2 Tax=Fletchervirus TaxID=1636618 RepID=G0LWS2_9CAUD|nr:hypothetical protein FDH13_gp075 [Campylobacter phage vB_CjeM_Los1]YP_009623323.1 hypothetical protein FDJ37_gp097 [Campylobacter phage CP81]AOT25896.1 hypothetical protein LOS1_00075 [Campylobacter phage vB_CjeM_Los1]CBZ42264.1 hypothetical protein [Campylobacter phage CP81]
MFKKVLNWFMNNFCACILFLYLIVILVAIDEVCLNNVITVIVLTGCYISERIENIIIKGNKNG